MKSNYFKSYFDIKTDKGMKNDIELIRDIANRFSNLSTDEILKMNQNRSISNSTGMNCSKCGSDFKISNRFLLPFEFEILNGHIGKIWIPCPRCDERYDLGICKFY